MSGITLIANSKLGDPGLLGLPHVTVANGVSAILDTLSFIAGVLSVIFIVVAGIQYATSSGNPNRIEGAKSTLLYAVVGLILSLLAYSIVGFVIGHTPS